MQDGAVERLYWQKEYTHWPFQGYLVPLPSKTFCSWYHMSKCHTSIHIESSNQPSDSQPLIRPGHWQLCKSAVWRNATRLAMRLSGALCEFWIPIFCVVPRTDHIDEARQNSAGTDRPSSSPLNWSSNLFLQVRDQPIFATERCILKRQLKGTPSRTTKKSSWNRTPIVVVQKLLWVNGHVSLYIMLIIWDPWDIVPSIHSNLLKTNTSSYPTELFIHLDFSRSWVLSHREVRVAGVSPAVTLVVRALKS